MPRANSRNELHELILRTLREERVSKKLSMNALSERAGLNQSAISLLERGLRSPNLDTLLRIADALEIDLWRLLRKATEAANLEPRGKR